MLRVRPLHYTSNIGSWERLLTALGLVLAEGDGGFRVYDAGAGRLALHEVPAGAAEDGTTALAVEVGDLAEFGRRTNLAAQDEGTTPAELVTESHGEACRRFVAGVGGDTPAASAAGASARSAFG